MDRCFFGTDHLPRLRKSFILPSPLLPSYTPFADFAFVRVLSLTPLKLYSLFLCVLPRFHFAPRATSPGTLLLLRSCLLFPDSCKIKMTPVPRCSAGPPTSTSCESFSLSGCFCSHPIVFPLFSRLLLPQCASSPEGSILPFPPQNPPFFAVTLYRPCLTPASDVVHFPSLGVSDFHC